MNQLKPMSQHTKDFIKRRVRLGKQYKNLYGKIKDIKHFKDFMKAGEKKLKINKRK